MIDKTKILSFIKERGPVIPRDLSKVFGGDTFFMGAVLSQMVDSKELKISSAKIGGSPAYYLSGQEEKLSLLYNFLPGKEKEAYDLLKEKKIIRDSETDPAIRVALRNIKDFAKPLEVNLPGKTEIFWKWHLLPNNDAEKKIKDIFVPQQETAEKKEQTIEKKEVVQEKAPEQQKTKPTEKPKTETEEIVKVPPQTSTKTESGLMDKLREIFGKKDIEIVEFNIIRKNDIELLIKLPSAVGKLTYFCKATDKKKVNDKDLSSVFVQSQMKKLPALYATTGQISKKGKEMLEKEFKIISVMNI